MAKSHYLDWLGFHLDWEYRPEKGPSVLEVSRGNTTLHLSEHYGDGSAGAKLFVEVDDVDALLVELNRRPNDFMKPGIEETEWGARILTILDPFGNRIVFSQTLDARNQQRER